MVIFVVVAIFAAVLIGAIGWFLHEDHELAREQLEHQRRLAELKRRLDQ
jgi:hypothetical protein